METCEKPSPPTFGAVIVAAGRGRRMGGDLPKQYQMLDGVPVISRTVDAFVAHPKIAEVVIVIHPDDANLAAAALKTGVRLVHGGETRDASVLCGINAIQTASHVLIHDAARPLISATVIDRVCDALLTHDGAAPALPVTDALWHGETTVSGTRSRNGLWRAQTPQGFRLSVIREAHESHSGGAADDVEVARAAGVTVAIVDGDEANLKLTYSEDFLRANNILKGKAHVDIRLGNGYDVHRFGDGDHVVLCGIKLPHGRGLQGHSDADVGLHAITDAIYGAMAQGDIGRHFPPSDPQWKGAPSHIFLAHAAGLARDSGFAISNIDCTLVCEQPKIGPHAAAMQTEVARICGIDPSRVSVKATTSERLGFTGREEGIACLATAALVKS